MAFTASYIAACTMAKLRVGWTLAGCAPGVRTIVRSVLFHCITGFSCAAADSALLEGQMLREQIAHAVASDVEIRDMVRSSGKVKRHFGASHAWLCLPWIKTHGARKIFQGSSIISKWHVTPVSSRALLQIQITGLESFEKADQLLFFSISQPPKASDHMLGLTLVPFDGVLQGQRSQVMHESGTHPQAPKRLGAQLVRGILRSRLYDAVARLDVMQQEITVRVNDFVALPSRLRCAGQLPCYTDVSTRRRTESHQSSRRLVFSGYTVERCAVR